MKQHIPFFESTIVAPATAPGMAAISMIRISGKDAFAICSRVFRKHNGQEVNVATLSSHTVHFGIIEYNHAILDEVLMSVFRQPHSYTGEDVVEISCHGSVFIRQQLLHVLTQQGAQLAQPGEFTLRAFLNHKMDLSQAEAVADLIASHSALSHRVALRQMRGGFSIQLRELREQLLNFASLIELELDFSEEDVKFANREELSILVAGIRKIVCRLIDSFSVGNAIRNGIPVVIAGKPNAGKSTLLNTLLNEERAIVSEIPGTTRDTVEEDIILDGIRFRFIDTAGIRDTEDAIETLGVNRTFEKIRQSAVILYLFDVHEMSGNELQSSLAGLRARAGDSPVVIIPVANKIDKENLAHIQKEFAAFPDVLFISAREKHNIDRLIAALLSSVNSGQVDTDDTIVTNARHVEALSKADHALQRAAEGLEQNLSGDLLAEDIRAAMFHLGEITGDITPDDILKNIFGRFCIGK